MKQEIATFDTIFFAQKPQQIKMGLPAVQVEPPRTATTFTVVPGAFMNAVTRGMNDAIY